MKSRLDRLTAGCQKADPPWQIGVRGLTPREATQLIARLEAAGIKARMLDGREIRDKPKLLKAVAKAYELPGHFGHNWDALLDCLSDFHWLPAKGYVCILLHADKLKAADPQTYRTFLDVCQAAAERWAERGSGVFFRLVRSTR